MHAGGGGGGMGHLVSDWVVWQGMHIGTPHDGRMSHAVRFSPWGSECRGGGLEGGGGVGPDPPPPPMVPPSAALIHPWGGGAYRAVGGGFRAGENTDLQIPARQSLCHLLKLSEQIMLCS